MAIDHISSNLSLFGYVIAAVLYLWAFQHKSAQEKMAKLAFAIFVVATILATVALSLRFPEQNFSRQSGLMLTCVISWLTVIGHKLFNLRMIGALVAPLLTFLLLIQFMVAPSGALTPTGKIPTIVISFHISMAIIGEAFGILACMVSIFYLWQQNLLKKKLLDQIPENIPAIDRLDRILLISLWAGFIFITIGLVSGAVFSQMYLGENPMHLGYKAIWAIVVWLWYLAILLARNVFNRSAKRIAQMSLAGFLLMAFTYFGIGFFTPVGAGS